MNDFLDYALSLNPGLLHVYVQGHLHDLSPHAVTSTFVGAPRWMRSRHGHLLHAGAAGNLQLGDPASCRATTDLVIIAFGDFARLEADGRIVAKRSGALAATCDYDLFLANTPAISLFDGVTTSTLNVDYRGARSLTARVADGAAPDFFVDGVLAGVGGAALDVDDDGNTLYVLAREGGADRLQAALGALLIFVDAPLTDEQISDLHRLYLEDARGVPTAPARTISLPKHDLNGALLYLAGPKNALGNVVDLSGNGLDAAVTGRVGEEREHVSGTRAQHFHGAGAGVVTVPASALLTGHVGQTYSGLVRIDGDGEGTTGRIFSVNEGIAERIRLHPQGGTTLTFGRRFSDGIATWRLSNRPGDGLPYHYLLRHDGDPTHVPTININGRAAALTVVAARAGVVNTNAPQAYFGNVGGLGRNFNGILGASKFHGSVLSDTEARNEYLQHGTRAIELAPRRAYPVTLVDVAAGRVGPWDRISGTWSYRDDGERRQLVNVVAGACAVPSDQAYGAHYFRFKKRGAGNVLEIMLSASRRAARNDAAQNGYALRVLADESVTLDRITGGAVVNTVFSSVANYIALDTEYEVLNACAYDGYRVSWIRGGVFTAWTVIGSGTDNTYTSSQFMVVDIDVNDEVNDFIVYPLGDTLDPSAGDMPGYAAQEGPRFINDQSTLHNTTIQITCPAGGVAIAWGDGEYSAIACNGVLNTYTHAYTVTGQYTIRILGNIEQITDFRCHSQAWISGDISSLSGLTSLVVLRLYSTSVSGDLSAVSGLTSLVYLRLFNTSVSGDISAVSPLTSLTHLYLYNTSVSGDISAVSGLTLLVVLYLFNTSVSTYTSTPLPAWAGATLSFDGLGLSTEDLDDFLIDLADGVGAGVTVDCLTGNGPRSGASDAAVAAIVAAGGAVT